VEQDTTWRTGNAFARRVMAEKLSSSKKIFAVKKLTCWKPQNLWREKNQIFSDVATGWGKSSPKTQNKNLGASQANIPAKNLRGVGGGLVDSVVKVAACASPAAIAMWLLNVKAGEARHQSGAPYAGEKRSRLAALPRKSRTNIRASSAALSFAAARKSNAAARPPAGPRGSKFAPSSGTISYLPSHAEIRRATIIARASARIALRLASKSTWEDQAGSAKTRHAERR
jgi:hypothetical protein